MNKLIIFLTICLFGHSISLNIGNHAEDIIVSMKSGVEEVHQKLRSLKFVNREERLNGVYRALTEQRDKSQKEIINFLNHGKFSYESLWISNQIFIRNANQELIEQIQSFSGVSEITLNKQILIDSTLKNDNQQQTEIKIESGISRIDAPRAWAEGWTGNGAKVGIIDAGARYTHQAIVNNFAGDYGWRDPYSNSQSPNDGNGHGTHSTGTAVGILGIGVAHNATWMACMGCNFQGSCGQAQLLTCGQFMICPTDPSGNNPDCSKAPRVVSNSWGGGSTGNWFDSVLMAWEMAEIIGVFPCGSPNCAYPGNTRSGVSVSGSNTSMADFVAPSQSVRSAYHTSDTAYSTLSGDGKAADHVSGTFALMFGKNPNLSSQEAFQILCRTTDPNLNAYNIEPKGNARCGFINAYRATLAA